jgi:hypothetical protein
MSLISVGVPNLINGVSQQAEGIRFSSQANEQVNAYSDVVEGLTKRPPLEHIKKLNSSAAGTAAKTFVHFINRGAGEQFVLLITPTGLEVYDLAGNAKTVVNAQGNPISSGDLTYVLSSSPREDLKALTVLDHTFLLNRTKKPVTGSSTVSTRSPEALLFLRVSRISTKYTIKLYNTVGVSVPSFTITYTSTASPLSQADILTKLVQALTAAGVNSTYTYSQNNASLYIRKNDLSDFKVEAFADAPEHFYAFKDTIQSFSVLPEQGYIGMKFLVKGSPTDDSDDYYVEFVPQRVLDSAFEQGRWEEAPKGGIVKTFNNTLMPHALVWDSGNNRFQFKPLTWDDRVAGDNDSNPAPSFTETGKTINDIFFYRDRLGFLSGENVILSEAGSYFNFWRTTVISLLDSDPIDVSASDTSISILRHAISSNERLVLFAENKQFVLPSDDLLTPRTIRIDKASETPNYKNVSPVSLGNFIFFSFERGSFSGVQQYSLQADTQTFEPFDISAHVPQYLKGATFKLSASPTENVLIALTDGFSSGCYVYRFYDRGRDRLQSAWFKFDFGSANEIRDVFFLNSAAYFVIARADGTFLEKMSLEAAKADDLSSFRVLVDRRVTEASCILSYSQASDETSIVLPFTPDSGSSVQVVTRAVTGATSVYLLPTKRQTGSTVYVSGDKTTKKLWAGQKFQMEQDPTRPTLRERGPSGDITIHTGRFQVHSGLIAFNDSVFFKVQVTPRKGASAYTYVFNSRSVGEVDSLVAVAPVPKDSEPFRFPVRAKSDEVSIKIINDSPFPCKLLSLDYLGTYNSQHRRV